jgi:hypothetical protein
MVPVMNGTRQTAIDRRSGPTPHHGPADSPQPPKVTSVHLYILEDRRICGL